MAIRGMERQGAFHEGQVGFKRNRSCIDNVHTLNKLVQKEGKPNIYTGGSSYGVMACG